MFWRIAGHKINILEQIVAIAKGTDYFASDDYTRQHIVNKPVVSIIKMCLFFQASSARENQTFYLCQLFCSQSTFPFL